MDNELFLKRLSELTEWQRAPTGPNGCQAGKRGVKDIEKPPPITEEELNEMSDDEVQKYYDQLIKWRESQPNESIAPTVTRIKCQAKKCDDCDKILEESRRIEYKQYSSGSKHWRHRCTNCNRYCHPITKEFSISHGASHQFFTDFYRPKLGKYNSKNQPNVVTKHSVEVKVIRDKIKEYNVVETDEHIIRSFDKESSDNT